MAKYITRTISTYVYHAVIQDGDKLTHQDLRFSHKLKPREFSALLQENPNAFIKTTPTEETKTYGMEIEDFIAAAFVMEDE